MKLLGTSTHRGILMTETSRACKSEQPNGKPNEDYTVIRKTPDCVVPSGFHSQFDNPSGVGHSDTDDTGGTPVELQRPSWDEYFMVDMPST